MIPPFYPYLRLAFDEASGRPLAQAATVAPDGWPEVRTVVLRDLAANGAASFASDLRSAKFAALAARPWLELCLWQATAGVQLRWRGRATVHAGDLLARSLWRSLPLATRSLFAAPAPGQPRLRGSRGALQPARPPGDGPPPSFAVVRVQPERCERLLLGPPLERRRWTLEGQLWSVQDLVP